MPENVTIGVYCAETRRLAAGVRCLAGSVSKCCCQFRHVAFFAARERQPDDDRDWRKQPKLAGMAYLWPLFDLAVLRGAGAVRTVLSARGSGEFALGGQQKEARGPAQRVGGGLERGQRLL
jgi:hypothetical protein